MKYSKLGLTDLTVSRLCFGSLTLGPLQLNLSPRDGGAVLKAAIARGINFIDTAELYENYAHLQEGCRGERDIILASKSYAYTFAGMKASVEKALRETKRDYLDIFSLHEQSSRLTLKGHRPALEYLVKAKKEGLIRAIGVSTHFVEVVRAAAMLDEVDVIHPLLNQRGLGIADGTVDEMLAAIDFATYMGKGIYGMKILGGGHLSRASEQAFGWALNLKNIASFAVGMRNEAEVEINTSFFAGRAVDQSKLAQVKNVERKIFVEEYCTGCGSCLAACQNKALSLQNGQAVIERAKCVGCAYCAARCEHFCIKVL